VSVIENALQKLRARAESSARAAAVEQTAARHPGKPVSTASVKVSLVHEVSAVPEQPLKRLAVNVASLRAAGYLPTEEQRRRFADQYRRIKRPLIEKAFAPSATAEMRLILVTSALPGDGKTFTTVNLALSMGRERDVAVLLVDADVPRARVSHVFGVHNEPGLMDTLLDESVDPESLIIRTDMQGQGLDVLPAGRPVDNATELLASTRMIQVAARLASRNPKRIVLFDSSPLLGSSETDSLVRVPGQIVLVVRASATPRHAVLEAMTHIDPKRFQGFILNQMPAVMGGGYYYGYSGYGSSGDDSAPAG